jgi:GTP-binding protein
MIIHSAEFIKGLVGEDSVLYDGTPQIAFIGRSNVGKSSTLNAILSRKKLVKTGKTPGKTKEINFFEIKNELKTSIYFVDLPGYGYAKVSKNDRQKLGKLIQWYVTHPEAETALICLIIDAKVGLTDFDKQVLIDVQEQGKRVIIGVNKIDKINQKTQSILKKELLEYLGAENADSVIFYSAANNKGTHKILDYIEKVLGE